MLINLNVFHSITYHFLSNYSFFHFKCPHSGDNQHFSATVKLFLLPASSITLSLIGHNWVLSVSHFFFFLQIYFSVNFRLKFLFILQNFRALLMICGENAATCADQCNRAYNCCSEAILFKKSKKQNDWR